MYWSKNLWTRREISLISYINNRVFNAYIMWFIVELYRLNVGEVVHRDKLITRSHGSVRVL